MCLAQVPQRSDAGEARTRGLSVSSQALRLPLSHCAPIWADPEWGTGGPESPEKLQKIGILSNTGPDPPKNHKATKPEFNVGPSSARQRNAKRQ